MFLSSRSKLQEFSMTKDVRKETRKILMLWKIQKSKYILKLTLVVRLVYTKQIGNIDN